jgi:hypothetical protein
VEGSCEHGNEPSDVIKYWKILEWLHSWRLSRRAQLHEVSFSRVTTGFSSRTELNEAC